MSLHSPLFIAHRGESCEAPENMLSAINLAWEKGAHAVEIDIQLTLDNEIVVYQDKNTLRTAGIKKVIKNTTLSELRKLNAGSFKGKRFSKEKIPILKEVLQTVPQGAKLVIEIKSDRQIIPKLKEELAASGLQNSQIEIITFNLHKLSETKVQMPQYTMLWLLDLDYFWPAWLTRLNIPKTIAKVKAYNLDGIDV